MTDSPRKCLTPGYLVSSRRGSVVPSGMLDLGQQRLGLPDQELPMIEPGEQPRLDADPERDGDPADPGRWRQVQHTADLTGHELLLLVLGRLDHGRDRPDSAENATAPTRAAERNQARNGGGDGNDRSLTPQTTEPASDKTGGRKSLRRGFSRTHEAQGTQ